MKTIAILQSNYIPWKGYFDMIASVDEFIILDEVQYTKNDWRNRNLIKTPSGPSWLTIPVSQGINQLINEVVAVDGRWRKKHWKNLEANYRKSPHFKLCAEFLEPLYLQEDASLLSEINLGFIRTICEQLEIETKISSSKDYTLLEGQTERLLNLCTQAGADRYVSGPAAKNYLDTAIFDKEGVCIEWFNYADYRAYPQLWGEFTHNVSILDLLFNCGNESKKFMKYTNL